MAEANRKLWTESGIPSGLNRIKTRRVAPKERRSSIAEDSEKLNESPYSARPHEKQKQRATAIGHVKISSPKEGHRAKRIARWFASHLSKHSGQAVADVSQQLESSDLEVKKFEEGHAGEVCKVMRHSNGKESSAEDTGGHKVPKGLKSFSHELGPKRGIPYVHPRARSFNDLKELLGSLHSKFDAAKEVVNTELECFSKELMDTLQKKDSLSIDEQRMAEELLILAQQCIDMEITEFRSKCEKIVQDLTVKRQQCQTGLLKWLLTRMLFILTRCTRLLHFEKDNEPLDKKSLYKFQECLESIPSIEVNWFENQETVRPVMSCIPDLKDDSKGKSSVRNHTYMHSQANQCKSEEPVEEEGAKALKDLIVTGSYSNGSHIHPSFQHSNVLRCKLLGESSHRNGHNLFQEQEHFVDDLNLVICRICEKLVPITHLEFHSYICAYADKCDLITLDVNERLLRFAELLEQLVESRNFSPHTRDDSPENSRVGISDSAIASEVHSPKVSEWRSKGVEGMFEDLHEMDTACIEDYPIAAFMNSRGHLGVKLNLCGPPSSTGSMTPASSMNTPRGGNFDIFWIDHNNPSELKDAQQMAELADIARCVAGTDLSGEGSNEFLLACMQDLQDLLQHSKFKALVIDTFGGRIENLLREKFILACNLVDVEIDIQNPEISKMVLDNVCQTQSSALSTPSHPLHKERTSIDDFEIIKPISRGAFGKVYLARKRATGDLFAIKVLNKMDMLRKNDIDRILAERNILITVRNPFLVRFFYSFTSRDHLYLVMEYLNGGDLYSLLHKVGCLEEDVARFYISELVLALEYLHSLGIVHRDLKPDNILIGQDGHIKLTDFGLSKIGLMNSTSDLSGSDKKEITLLENQARKNTDTMDRSERSAVGTPDYLAPEILLGTKHGYAVDWWSVGIILFELITGFPPFTGELPEIIFDNILNRHIPWPSVPTEMSYEAQDLIDRLLDHDPDQRLGANGASELKVHPFFRGVEWDNLTSQEAVFVPQPDSVDDTSYFVSRYNSSGVPDDGDCSDSVSDTSESCSDSGLENADECGDLAEFNSSPLDLSLINFSFKNLSQLASINHDMLLQGGKDSPNCSSPCKYSEE